MSATPETDTAIIEADGAWTFALKDKMQSLERERDEARELSRELRDALEFMLEGGLEGPTPQSVRGAQDVLTKAKEVLP